jgi:hypothetical protein
MSRAQIHVQNSRWFPDCTVVFHAGMQGMLGESHAEKTALLSARGRLVDRRSRKRPSLHAVHHGTKGFGQPPAIALAVILRSTARDTLQDKTLVALGLPQPGGPRVDPQAPRRMRHTRATPGPSACSRPRHAVPTSSIHTARERGMLAAAGSPAHACLEDPL